MMIADPRILLIDLDSSVVRVRCKLGKCPISFLPFSNAFASLSNKSDDA